MSLREAAEKALEALEITTAFVDGCPIDWGRGYVPEADEAITTLRTALAEADDRKCTCHPDDNPPKSCPRQFALGECRRVAALAEAEEPVAWYSPSGEGYDSSFRDHSTVVACDGGDWSEWIPLYTHPPRREPLTEEQIASVQREIASFSTVWLDLTRRECRIIVRIIERAHGIGGDE